MGVIEILIIFLVVVVTIYLISRNSANSKKIKKENIQQQPSNNIKKDIEKTLEDRAPSLNFVDKNFLKNSFSKSTKLTNLEVEKKVEVVLEEDKNIVSKEDFYDNYDKSISIFNDSDYIEEDDLYENEYDIGIGSEFSPSSNIAKEYSELTPEMKLVLTTNILGNDKNQLFPNFEEVEFDGVLNKPNNTDDEI